ncbi:MAG: insulinase family protein [Chlamydiae bacterium]|nr:insulinase family protein [Chlamydiota bacterium]
MKKANLLYSLLFLSSFSSLTLFSEETVANYEIVEDKAKLEILTPALEKRKVAKLVLSNGMHVYLVSDPGIDQSAAAVSVEAGAWQDPKEYPGMAHFLEHMLFMGTAAYPDESEYMHFIGDNGGKVNAFTASDRTVYMFSVNNEAFEGALDRFSHFFIDPLFSTSSINRELHAVDQEHAKNIQNDMWREYMIFKETGNKDHPNAKFSTGNAQTLSGIPQSALKEWYAAHYSSDQMNLVLISPLPLETLIELASEKFSKAHQQVVDNSLSDLPMFSPEQKGHVIYIKPVKDLRVASIIWELPKQFSTTDEKWTADLTAFVLNQESENSLIHQLKKEKIAVGLHAYCDRYSHNNVLFIIDIQLTEQGISNVDTAVARCFQAIAKMKEQGISLQTFDEMQTITKIEYQYQSRDDAFDVISDIAYNLVDEDLATFPEGTKIPSSYNPKSISTLLSSLTPDSCVYFVMADPEKTGIATDQQEKWMAAEYTVKPLSDEKLTALKQVQPHPSIGMPPANPFIPSHLALVSEEKDAKLPIIPTLIANDDKAKVYFAQDTRYLVPQVSMIYGLRSPLMNGSARSSVLLDLYLKSLNEKLSSTLSFADSAGLSASFYNQNLKMTLSIQGYSEKAPQLAKEIFSSLKNLQVPEDQFQIYRQSLLSGYDNASKELPVRQAMEIMTSVMLNDAPTNAEKMRELDSLSYDEFNEYTKRIFESVYVESLVYGNMTEPEARSLWSELKPAFETSTAYPVAQQRKKNVLVLPHHSGPFQIMETTEMQGNGVVLVIEEGPFSFEKRASQQILAKALQESFFETLRTKQQTGYIAKAWDSEIERQLIQCFAVQSSTHNPTDLLMRFELFLEEFTKHFTTVMTDDRFENMRKMITTTLQMPPENMSGMASKLNTLAFDYEGDFTFVEKRIEAIQKLSYDQLKKDANYFLSRKNQRRLAILMEGVLAPDNDFHYEPIAKEELCNMGTYVSYK